MRVRQQHGARDRRPRLRPLRRPSGRQGERRLLRVCEDGLHPSSVRSVSAHTHGARHALRHRSRDCTDAKYNTCHIVSGGGSYCTNTGCADDTACDGGYACDISTDPAYCERPPTGDGQSCARRTQGLRGHGRDVLRGSQLAHVLRRGLFADGQRLLPRQRLLRPHGSVRWSDQGADLRENRDVPAMTRRLLRQRRIALVGLLSYERAPARVRRACCRFTRRRAAGRSACG